MERQRSLSRGTSFIEFLESDIETAINKAITGSRIGREKPMNS
jgi:hypothetical protein